jgi:Loader and inhibitor of phage G40P
MTKLEAARLVACLFAAYPAASSNVNNRTTEIFERMLGDLDYVVANAAVERLIATSRFMPTIAEIREACMDLSLGERRAGGEAWGSVLRAISGAGIYRKPGVDFVFNDPVVARCVAALGWEELCNSENQHADRARFIELYDKLAVSTRKEQNTGALPAAQRLKALEDAPIDIVRQLAEAKAVKS